jgi:hypothetical protein
MGAMNGGPRVLAVVATLSGWRVLWRSRRWSIGRHSMLTIPRHPAHGPVVSGSGSPVTMYTTRRVMVVAWSAIRS